MPMGNADPRHGQLEHDSDHDERECDSDHGLTPLVASSTAQTPERRSRVRLLGPRAREIGRTAYSAPAPRVRHLRGDARRDPRVLPRAAPARAQPPEVDLVGALELPQVRTEAPQLRLQLEVGHVLVTES